MCGYKDCLVKCKENSFTVPFTFYFFTLTASQDVVQAGLELMMISFLNLWDTGITVCVSIPGQEKYVLMLTLVESSEERSQFDILSYTYQITIY